MPSCSAEILSQGDEVVTGQVVDTNAAWLAQRLVNLGFEVARHGAVPDRLEPMIEELRRIAARSDVCISTGGLGPTVDDLTAEAVARAFDAPLALDAEALTQIEAFFADRGLPMPSVNRKQALLPAQAIRLDNRWGSAPGFALRHERCWFVFLPGVPSEMTAMFDAFIEAELRRRFQPRPSQLLVWRTVGLGESTLQQRLEPLDLPAEVHLGFRASVPENEVKLLFPHDFPRPQRDALAARVTELLGEAVVSLGTGNQAGGTLAAVVGELLMGRGARLATLETVSGGSLAWQCRERPWLIESIIAHDIERVLEAPDPALATEEQRAAYYAERLRARCGADYALINVGERQATAEPGAKANGAYAAVASPGETRVERITLSGTGERRLINAGARTLDVLRRQLLAKPQR
ncbi:MAG: molybdopterin-binding protein [Methylotetracoccus sp.]